MTIKRQSVALPISASRLIVRSRHIEAVGPVGSALPLSQRLTRYLIPLPVERPWPYSISKIDRAPEEVYREEVPVEPVRQPFGGRRWYFRCPRCDRRRACLYVLRMAFRFRCRMCYGLAYHAQRLDRL